MENDETFRVWVACLACYNEGRLVGEWFDAIDAPQTMEDWVERMPSTAPVGEHSAHVRYGHEELWCLDIDNSPVDGEMSPMDAAHYAGLIENLSIPLAALTAWLSYQHEELTEESIETATERYWTDDADTFDDSIRDLHPEESLPEWAKCSYGDIIDNVKRDMDMNGEYVELEGYFFRTY